MSYIVLSTKLAIAVRNLREAGYTDEEIIRLASR